MLESYRTLFIHCERAGKPGVVKQSGVVPAGERQSKSKRCYCPWRVNINAPPSNGGIPHFTKVHLEHNHDIWDPTENRARLLDNLTKDEVGMIAKLAVAGAAQPAVTKVKDCHFHSLTTSSISK